MGKSIVAQNAKRIITERGYKQKAIAALAGYNEKTFKEPLIKAPLKSHAIEI